MEVVERRGEEIVLRPIEEQDLEELIGSIEVDVDSRAFSDYDELKRALLGEVR